VWACSLDMNVRSVVL